MITSMLLAGETDQLGSDWLLNSPSFSSISIPWRHWCTFRCSSNAALLQV